MILIGTQRGCTSRTISTHVVCLVKTAGVRHHSRLPTAAFALHFVQRQRYSSSTVRNDRTAAIVVGAGPAGIAVVGNLLENTKDGKIVWIDPEFNGGRINKKYREVPGNTAVKLFVDYAKAVKPFQEIYETAPKPNAVTVLEHEFPEQSGTCSLSYAGDMLSFLTDGLKKHPRVQAVLAEAKSAQRDPVTKSWTLTTSVSSPQQPAAPLLVYCTGSHPTLAPLPTISAPSPTTLPLDTALTPSLLKDIIPSDCETTVAVIGGSHSAILVLMNLFSLATSDSHHPNLRVKWFTRSSTLTYAEPRDGYILNDNTGLKGRAAAFARTQLDGDALLSSPAGKVITRVDCSGGKEKEWAQFEKELKVCAFVVHAVGYTRGEIPQTSVGVPKAGENKELKVNPRTGAFEVDGKEVGLFGAGIAFPEEIDVPEGGGKTEYAVGMWKFMKFLRRVVPEWVQKTGAGGR
ncbi:pyridine nucleotide-disulfide oxidoreductase-domain-containing protein [Podospora australis]|uniref:Pyridine nucleotide-disulfide oxidoreductase-domain-containing protein n=1 Tax=Podospora australis TaxID=1536484 RepID=A0AAN6WIN4_9PEZI|nr:pyridine nucleotide-disulfide oxidoreductase-domain-containing protein [Podospora australis]